MAFGTSISSKGGSASKDNSASTEDPASKGDSAPKSPSRGPLKRFKNLFRSLSEGEKPIVPSEKRVLPDHEYWQKLYAHCDHKPDMIEYTSPSQPCRNRKCTASFSISQRFVKDDEELDTDSGKLRVRIEQFHQEGKWRAVKEVSFLRKQELEKVKALGCPITKYLLAKRSLDNEDGKGKFFVLKEVTLATMDCGNCKVENEWAMQYRVYMKTDEIFGGLVMGDVVIEVED
jgi:hypothetical protein